MELVKAHWLTDGDRLSLSMPLSKIDKENRMVSGFASLDNADSQGDIIVKEANTAAFDRFRGNLREMHQPIAAGRMVKFREEEFYDPKTQKFYNGIWVDCHVSLGAQSTWEKVLDGTLQGFSIGGNVLKSKNEFVKEDDATRRFVTDYELVELSLVDSPANVLANVFSIKKVSGSNDIVTGMIAETKSENVFLCEQVDCEIAKTSSEDTLKCSNGHSMTNIGWFEYDGTEAVKTEKVRSIVMGFLTKEAPTETPEMAKSEGGVNMADKKETVDVTKVAEVDEATKSVEVETAAEVKAETVEAPKAEVNEFIQAFEAFTATLDAKLEKSQADHADVVTEINNKFDKFMTEVNEKTTALSEKLAELHEGLGKTTKSVEILEGDSAIKKSGDLGGSSEPEITKSSGLWSNSIL